MSKQTQIALDFGDEPQPAPPEAVDTSPRVEEPARPYMAAAGVGVRIKSYKHTPAPQTGDLFGADAPGEPAAAEAESIVNESLTASTPPPGQPGPEPEVVAPAAEMTPPAPVSFAPEPEVAKPDEVVAATPEWTMTVPGATVAIPESTVTVQEPTTATSEPEAIMPTAVTPEPAAVEPEPAAQTATIYVAKPVATTPATKRTAPAAKTAKVPSKRGRKSLKQITAEADLIVIPSDEVLFSKQYYTMGEVSAMFQVNQSLLRFWESEFDILQPRKNKKGDRHFRPVDIKNLHFIYHLLRQKKYTIEGAKEFLKNNKKADERFLVIQRLEEIKAFLQEMKAQL